jgi:1,4-alpha-glucan branching enzyme
MAERCGAWQVGDGPDGPVEFRIFFPAGADPEIDAIRVAGDFQHALGGADWDFAAGPALQRDDSDPRGTFWVARTPELPQGFYEYKYEVEFAGGERRRVSDPCTRYGGRTDQRAAVVVGGSAPADNVVPPVAGGRRPLADLNVYELMIDDFTAGYRDGRAPLEAVMDRLDDLAGLGFNAILFMPWTTWLSDAFDWGYAPFQYFAVEPRYADAPDRPAEKLSLLKRLVAACHERGIHVIMDGVFNHVSMDFPYRWLYRSPAACPYTAETFGGSFPGLQDLDFNEPCTNELIRDVSLYWIETFGIDGIRFDNTVNYYVAGDVRGLPELLTAIHGWLADHGERNFSTTLEHIDVSAAAVTDAVGATSFWDNALHDAAFDGLWWDRLSPRLLNALQNRRYLTRPDALPTTYLSNHDHSHVAWQAGARENVGAAGRWYRTQPYVIALFTATATPLVQNGQEHGEDHFVPEDDHGTGRRVIPRPLRWKLADDPIGQALRSLHGTLAHARLAHPALRSANIHPAGWDESRTTLDATGAGIDVDRRLAVYHRWAQLADDSYETFVVVLSFADADQTVTVRFPVDGTWTDLLAGGTAYEVAGGQADLLVTSNWGRLLRHGA